VVAEYQRQTNEANKARTLGAFASLGGIAFTVITGIGLLNANSSVYTACDAPTSIEACDSIHNQESDWVALLEYSGALAIGGVISFLGANALDRRLLVRRFSRQLELDYHQARITNLEAYMQGLPKAIIDIVRPTDGTEEN
jgi:hypothetical protein